VEERRLPNLPKLTVQEERRTDEWDYLGSKNSKVKRKRPVAAPKGKPHYQRTCKKSRRRKDLSFIKKKPKGERGLDPLRRKKDQNRA